ncbi:MAG: Ig-like domain-containing protein [Bacteroidales bacterium]|nr:Ig-like domain-containing protein [Bacteroidales bacterium]
MGKPIHSFLRLFFLSWASLLLLGCHKDLDNQIETLKEDVSQLEQQISKLNESISTLSNLISALEKNDHIADISEFMDGSRQAYRITFTSGTSLVLHHGTNGVSPILGVRYNEEFEAYYWTIQMGPNGTPTWMTNSYGLRVRASGSVPHLKIEDGVWWFSLDDGATWNKCGWAPAQGESGTSIFTSVDTSDPYYVTFLLSDWIALKFPTQKAFDELEAQCQSVNDEIKTYTRMINGLDPNLFVKSVVQYQDGDVSGYRFTLENGKVLSIRNGFSSRDSVLLSAKEWTDGKYYWVFRNRSNEAYQWLRYQGEMICVTYPDVTPHIGIVDSLGTLYFTISYADGKTEMMRDAQGKAVAATGKIVPDFFTSADVSDMAEVVLTMADGTVIRLPRTREYYPSFVELSYGSTAVEPMKSYRYQLLAFTTDTLPGKEALPDFAAYQKASDTKLDAIAVDHGYVDDVYVAEYRTTVLENNLVAYDIIYDIRFSTGPSDTWDPTRKFRIALFLTWNSHSTMKVAEFDRLIPATSVRIPKSIQLKKGATGTLECTYAPLNTTDQVTWSSSDTKVATVSAKGLITAVGVGKCTITATMGKQFSTSTCTVTE